MKKLICVATYMVISSLFAQSPVPDADDVCECTKKISLNLNKEETNREINSCINSVVLAQKLKATLTDIESIKAKGDSTATVNIVFDDEKELAKYHDYLLKNCKSVKSLLASDNKILTKSNSNNKKAQEFYANGQDFLAQEKYDLALVEFNKAVKKDPDFAFAWDNMGIAYRRMNRFKEAIECYDKSLKLDPNGRVPLMNKAVAYSLMEKFPESVKTYKEFIRIHPEDPEGYYGAARIQFSLEEYDAGLDNLFKAYRLYSEQKSPYLQHAQDVLAFYYKHYNETKNIETFKKIASQNGINLNE